MAWPRSWFIGHSTPDGSGNSEPPWLASIMVFTDWKQPLDEKVCFVADREAGRGKRAAFHHPRPPPPPHMPVRPHLDHANPIPANAANITQRPSFRLTSARCRPDSLLFPPPQLNSDDSLSPIATTVLRRRASFESKTAWSSDPATTRGLFRSQHPTVCCTGNPAAAKPKWAASVLIVNAICRGRRIQATNIPKGKACPAAPDAFTVTTLTRPIWLHLTVAVTMLRRAPNSSASLSATRLPREPSAGSRGANTPRAAGRARRAYASGSRRAPPSKRISLPLTSRLSTRPSRLPIASTSLTSSTKPSRSTSPRSGPYLRRLVWELGGGQVSPRALYPELPKVQQQHWLDRHDEEVGSDHASPEPL